MTGIETLKRKYKLNRQAAMLIEQQRVSLQDRYILSRMLERLEKSIEGPFDPEVSQKIDAIHVLLEK